ncbi:MAG: winged helix-turn-helix domain-containing protein [Actinobacteria bacterium]|nr:winged helix-turn-helix domain-containing protein [Actinomycetota bacterium]
MKELSVFSIDRIKKDINDSLRSVSLKFAWEDIKLAKGGTAHGEGDVLIFDLRGVSGGDLPLLIEKISANFDPQQLKKSIAVFEMDQASVKVAEIFGDFVFEPINKNELKLRVEKILSVIKPRKLKVIAPDVKEIKIDTESYQAFLGSELLDLTYKEFELLKFLLDNKGKAFTRQVLLSQVWGYDYYGGTRTVDVHIRRLRSKLGDTTGELIQTVRNIGYRFSK